MAPIISGTQESKKMEGKHLDFKAMQIDLLTDIRKNHGPINSGYTELFQTCKRFLQNQKQQLKFLEEKRRTHMLEKGKFKFGLIPKEQVPLSDLKEIFTVFAKPLEDFIQHVTKVAKASYPTSASVLENLKEEALGIAREMLKISPVLESEPDCTNYDKKENKIPNLLILGAQCFSNLEIVQCHVTGVRGSDLQKASSENIPLDTVRGFNGFTVKAESTKQSKSSKSSATSQNPDALTTNLGIWFIPKNHLNPSDKGSAHKEWIRLQFTIHVKYHGISQSLWLLSLPFNIRKGSCQMYTFIGALMWYFYTTSDPYKDFTVPSYLSCETVIQMLVNRIEVIGRPLSQRAQDFFKDRLQCLGNNEKVELEVLARGPPSTKKDENAPAVDDTPTVDEAIEYYGFFTWFFALVKSLDDGGYLNKLWMDGYIYDICEIDHINDKVKKPEFGAQCVILRPSMSAIFKYQGKDINMGLAFFFKKIDQPGEVFSLSVSMDDIKNCGLYTCITLMLPLEYIYLKDGAYGILEDLKPVKAVDNTEKSYHSTRFRMARGAQLTSDSSKKHCSTCRCCNAGVNAAPDAGSQAKKVRNPSGNSDHISSTTSNWQTDSLTHKRRPYQDACSPSGSQMTSPPHVGASNQWHSFEADSPDSGCGNHMSPAAETRMPDFTTLLTDQKPCGNSNATSVFSTVTTREQLIANFYEVCKTFTSACSDGVIERLTKEIYKMSTGSPSQVFSPLPSSLPAPVSPVEWKPMDIGLIPPVPSMPFITDLDSGGVTFSGHFMTGTNGNENNNYNDGVVLDHAQVTYQDNANGNHFLPLDQSPPTLTEELATMAWPREINPTAEFVVNGTQEMMTQNGNNTVTINSPNSNGGDGNNNFQPVDSNDTVWQLQEFNCILNNKYHQ